MTYFTGLARVARDAGLKVVEVPGWKTRGHGHMELPKSIIVHHTAGAKTGNYPSLAVVRDGRTGLPGPLSHYGLGRDGTVYVIAAGLCAHAGKDSQLAWAHRNVRAIGIEAENTGVGEVWPAVQLDAYVRLCRALVDEFGLDTTDVLGHKEIAPGRKIDPHGINMGDFRAWVRNGRHPSSAITAQAAATITPKPLPKEDILAKLDNDDYEEIAKAVWRYDQQGKTPQAWHFQKNVGAIVWAHKLKSAFDGKLYQAASFLTVNNKHAWLLPGVQRLLEKLGTQAGVTKEDLDAAVSQVNDHTTETMADAVVDVEVTVKGKEATA